LSPEDGKPNKSGVTGRREPKPLNEGILTGSVVALTASGGVKTGPTVESESGVVMAADFEGGVCSSLLACPLQQGLKQMGPQSSLPMFLINGDHSDVEFVHHQPATGHSLQSALLGQAKAQATGILQLLPPLRLGPETIQNPVIQRNASAQPGSIEIDNGHL
tara:strand:+ start:237 stop:722 length:486 start_codon:yes stop_codon:yes gene_type:complete